MNIGVDAGLGFRSTSIDEWDNVIAVTRAPSSSAASSAPSSFRNGGTGLVGQLAGARRYRSAQCRELFSAVVAEVDRR